jgi:GTPase
MIRPDKKTKNADVPQRCGRIAIVGRPNVGKSTLLNTLLGERIAITSHQPQTTRDAILGVLTEGPVQYCFVDTPGIHNARSKLGARMNAQANYVAAGCDVVMFMTDVPSCRGGAFGEADLAILNTLAKTVPVVLVLNKIDVLSAKTDLFPLLAGLGAQHTFAEVVPLSATKRENTKSLLKCLAQYLPVADFVHDADELSDKPVRFFVTEFVREQVLRRTRQEVPHGVAVTIERYEELPRLTRISLVIHVDKASHKPIVIGRGAEMLKAIGTQARHKLEKLMGRKVHLETTVRVTEGWYERDDLLDEFGYSAGADEARKEARKTVKRPPVQNTPKAERSQPNPPGDRPVTAAAKAAAPRAKAPNSVKNPHSGTKKASGKVSVPKKALP